MLVGIIFALILVFCLFLWHRMRRTSRYQARLFLIFLLFILLPAIPLTLFSGYLVQKSLNLLNLPAVENALEQSMGALREQLLIRGRDILQRYIDDPEEVNGILRTTTAGYIGYSELQGDTAAVKQFYNRNEQWIRPPHLISKDDIMQLRRQPLSGRFYQIGNERYFETWLYRHNTVLFTGFKLDESLVQAIDNINRAYRNFSSFKMLQERTLEQGIIWSGVFVLLIALILLATAMARRVARGTSESIRILTSAMQRVASGDLSHSIDLKTNDEIDYLVRSFNRMIRELKQSREKLMRAERAAAWKDVAREISHEIKNPLTPMQFSIHRLKANQHIAGDPALTETLGVLESEIESLRRLAEAFSKVAKMPTPQPRLLQPESVINAAIDLYVPNPRLEIKVDIDRPLPEIIADEDQLKRVIQNLIKNAAEASGHTGEIRVRARRNDHIEITIEDKGCGMDEETCAKALQPYFTTKKEGSGLGLFLADRIIRDHGGQLWLSSRPGKGTRITFTLPAHV
ncbi:HAMP domain-containing protein [candidate division KSB1 bacterium]|nr:HAMP domain-containing protein [candidate division KSB1 bacterium]